MTSDVYYIINKSIKSKLHIYYTPHLDLSEDQKREENYYTINQIQHPKHTYTSKNPIKEKINKEWDTVVHLYTAGNKRDSLELELRIFLTKC